MVMFQSARLVYRAVEEDDVDKTYFLGLFRDTAAMANGDPRLLQPRNQNGADDFIKHIKNESLLSVMICLPDSSGDPTKPIGFMSLGKFKDQEHHRKSRLSLAIEAGQQGKGYGSEAIRWTLDWAFQTAGLHRVAIACFSFNEGARRLYERLNFTYEGRERESIWSKGKWHDLILFSMLEEDWREHYGTDIETEKESV